MDAITQYSSYFFIAAAILAAIILLSSLFRKTKEKMRGRNGQRLGITEYLELDKSRRLVLVRRDDTEHLILIGGPGDVIVESRIARPAPALSAGQDLDFPARHIMTPPMPPVFGDREPVLAHPPLAALRNRERR